MLETPPRKKSHTAGSNLQQTSTMEHTDDPYDNFELILRNTEPYIEGRDHYSTYFFSRAGSDVGVWFQQSLETKENNY